MELWEWTELWETELCPLSSKDAVICCICKMISTLFLGVSEPKADTIAGWQ